MKLLLMFCLAAVLSSGCFAQPGPSEIQKIGVGMWVWQPERCGSVSAMVDQAKEAGLGHVYLKVHDGVKPYGNRERTKLLALAMREAGIKVFVWGFNHANDPSTEAALIKRWLDRGYVDGYIYNTEAPLERQPKWGNTETMVKDVWEYRKSNHPEKLLGFAPYAIPSVHRALPYVILAQYTDFIEPQMYWETMRRSVKKVVLWTYRDWLKWEKDNELSKPIVPLGQTYGGVDPGEVVEFGKRTRGYYAVSFWSWQHTDATGWKEVQIVSQGRQSKWFDVASGEKPLPQAASLPYFWVRWWYGLLGFYKQGAILLLVCGTVFVSHVRDQVTKPNRKQVAWLAVAIASLWPYLLLLALAGATVWTLWYLWLICTPRRQQPA